MSGVKHETSRLLFICTGNYYRSRFAEGLFNHLAEEHDLPWWSYSRGLNINWIIDNTHISPFTRDALVSRDIDLRHTGERRMPLSRQDLEGADMIIGLKRAEHYPMIKHQFPGWEKAIEYLDVHDVDLATPDEALSQIEAFVSGLIKQMASSDVATV
ncbi:MAG: low molecular weight phosphatase family protein [Verrucomicrobiota bacterium]